MGAVVVVVVVSAGCRTRSEPENREPEPLARTSSLFQCGTVAENSGGAFADLKIFAERSEHPRIKPSIFISLGNGARVRAHCGERHDLGKKGVFACWYSGGGLTVSWPELEPSQEAIVKVRRKRLFGAIGNTAHKLRCMREDTLEAVRQAAL